MDCLSDSLSDTLLVVLTLSWEETFARFSTVTPKFSRVTNSWLFYFFQHTFSKIAFHSSLIICLWFWQYISQNVSVDGFAYRKIFETLDFLSCASLTSQHSSLIVPLRPILTRRSRHNSNTCSHLCFSRSQFQNYCSCIQNYQKQGECLDQRSKKRSKLSQNWKRSLCQMYL